MFSIKQFTSHVKQLRGQIREPVVDELDNLFDLLQNQQKKVNPVFFLKALGI